VLGVARELLSVAAGVHGKDASDRRVRLAVAEDPQGPRFAEHDGRSLIILSPGTLTDDLRQRAVYQLAHEATHAAISESSRYSWVDEMFATRFALSVVERLVPEYAQLAAAELRKNAQAATLRELLSADLAGLGGASYPRGIHELAWSVGRDLEKTIGWPAVRLLAGPGEPRRLADVDAWLAALPPEQATSARDVLQLGRDDRTSGRRILRGWQWR
jgi:hypothetical protein